MPLMRRDLRVGCAKNSNIILWNSLPYVQTYGSPVIVTDFHTEERGCCGQAGVLQKYPFFESTQWNNYLSTFVFQHYF